MRTVLLTMFFVVSMAGQEIDPGDVLDEARSLRGLGQHEAALEKYIWFFENSVQIERSYFGVKHSYCLEEWWDLGREFGKAKEAYLEMLADRHERLLEGVYSWDLFYEFKSMAESAGKDDDVVGIFKKWSNDNGSHHKASDVIDAVKEVLFDAEEFTLIDSHVDSYESWYSSVESGYVRNYKMYLEKDWAGEDFLRYAFTSFRNEVNQIVTVLNKVGKEGVAESIQVRAEKFAKANKIPQM